MKLCANCASVVDLDGFVECNDCTMEERALADDLADVLAKHHSAKDGSCVWEEDTPLPDVVQVLARWREARA
jgi:hypothetical protein